MHEISGEAGSGKTNFCLQLAVRCILPKRLNGLEAGVLYITTVKPLATRRLEQMLEKYCKMMKQEEIKAMFNRFHMRNFNYDEFLAFNMQIDNTIFENKIKLMIVDSITGLADVRFINDNNEVDYYGRANFLREYHSYLITFSQLTSFKNLIWSFKLFMIVTNNVYSFDQNFSVNLI